MRAEADELEFLPDVAAASRRAGHRFAYLLSLAVALFFAVFLVWSYFAVLDEVTRGEGQVIPSSRVQIIQNLEGGILAEILVREGDIVEAGDILVRIDNQTAQTNYRDARSQYFVQLAAIARLEAELDGAPLQFAREVVEAAPAAVADQRQLYEARQRQLAAQSAVLRSQVEQRRREIEEMRSRQKQLEGALGLAREQRDIAKPLAEQRVFPRMDYLRLERDVLTLEGDLDTLKLGIPRAEVALREAEQRIVEQIATFKAQASGEYNKHRQEAQSLSETLVAGRDRVVRTEVRAPVRGTVKQIMHSTIGGVIKPGEDIMEIVPLDDTLLVEARIRPADIAFLRPGQPAIVKITAYDFSIYGGLKGQLEQISADTIRDGEGESFFRIRIRTDRGTLTHGAQSLPIIPGMTASVDILTGKKSVLDYLLKPILKARERALRER